MIEHFGEPLKFYVQVDALQYPERISESETEPYFYQVGDRFINMFKDENNVLYDGVVIDNQYNPKKPHNPQTITVMSVSQV